MAVRIRTFDLHEPTNRLSFSNPNPSRETDFQKCYAGADVPEQCALQKEDYLECLHHTKEVRYRRGANTGSKRVVLMENPSSPPSLPVRP